MSLFGQTSLYATKAQNDSRYSFSGADGLGTNLVNLTASAILTVAQSGKKFTTAGTMTVTLPAPKAGLNYRIYGNSTGVVTLQAAAANLYFIDGTNATTATISQLTGSFVDVLCTGSNWSVFSSASITQIAANAPAINGSASQVFNVATALGPTQAVPLAQLQKLGIGSAAAVIYSTSTTLTTANAGQVVFYTGSSPGTFTLPLSASAPGYTCIITINNRGTGPLTVATQGGDYLSLMVPVIQSDQQVILVNDGGSTWNTLNADNGTTSPFVVGPAVASNQAAQYAQLGNLNGVIAPANTQTLTSSAYGQAIQVDSGAVITLPPNGANGQLIYFYSGGNIYSIVSNSNQFIYAPSLGMTSVTGPITLTCANGEDVLLLSRGNEFDVIGGSILLTGVTGTTTYAGSATFNGLLTGGTITGKMSGYSETLTTVSNLGSAYTINYSLSNNWNATLTTNCSLTFANPPAGLTASFTLFLVQGGSGSFTVSWPASVSWGSTGAPTLSTAAGATDVFTFVTVNGGTKWLGFMSGKGY